MQKAIVIGCPGAGKSHFARALRDKTSLPLYYLDVFWHKPDKTTVSQENFDAKLRTVLESERWIIDGNYIRTLETRLKMCDSVFLLDIPTEICLQSAASRVGIPREDMPWVEDQFDEDFRRCITEFPKTQLPEIYRLLEKYNDKSLFIFKSRSQSEDYLKILQS